MSSADTFNLKTPKFLPSFFIHSDFVQNVDCQDESNGVYIVYKNCVHLPEMLSYFRIKETLKEVQCLKIIPM